MAGVPQSVPQLTPEQQKELQEKLKKMSPEELLEFQRQQCVFCQIVAGKVPSKKIQEDDLCLAIMDINPATRGHVLVVPKEHYAIMPLIPDKTIGHLFTVAKKLSQLLLKGLRVDGTTIFVANGLVAGQRAQHFMIHVIPRKEGDGLLALQEHFADETEQVRAAVGNRLAELLGLKKEIVAMKGQPKKKVKELSEQPELSEGALAERREKKPKKTKVSDASLEKSLDDSPREGQQAPAALGKQKKASSKKRAKKAEDKKAEEPAEQDDDVGTSEQNQHDKGQDKGQDKEDQGVDLDDIANLFR